MASTYEIEAAPIATVEDKADEIVRLIREFFGRKAVPQ
jgi:hypothetical protein